jgi:hypothetical protein
MSGFPQIQKTTDKQRLEYQTSYKSKKIRSKLMLHPNTNNLQKPNFLKITHQVRLNRIRSLTSQLPDNFAHFFARLSGLQALQNIFNRNNCTLSSN